MINHENFSGGSLKIVRDYSYQIVPKKETEQEKFIKSYWKTNITLTGARKKLGDSTHGIKKSVYTNYNRKISGYTGRFHHTCKWGLQNTN